MASRFGERFFVKSRFEKRRNTVCISSFSNRRIGGKDPAKRADAIVRGCLTKKSSAMGAARARIAMEKLQALREGQTVGEEVILPVTLVVRGSTRIRK